MISSSLNMLGPLETYAWNHQAIVIAIHEKQQRQLRKCILSNADINNDILVLNLKNELLHFFSHLAATSIDHYTCHVAIYEPDNHWVSLLIQIKPYKKQFFILDSLGGYDSNQDEDMEEINNIITAIRQAFDDTISSQINIYVSRIKLQHDSYNCTRFMLYHIYSTTPSRVFDILENAGIESNEEDVTEIRLSTIPETLAKILTPIESCRTLVHMEERLKRASIGTNKSLSNTIAKHLIFNKKENKWQNVFIEHKKNKYIKHIKAFLSRNTEVNSSSYLFTQRNTHHITNVNLADILQQINDVDYWNEIKNQGRTTNIVDMLRHCINQTDFKMDTTFDELATIAKSYVLSEGLHTGNFHTHELCRMIITLHISKQETITINDSANLFLSETLRKEFDQLNSLSDIEFNEFARHAKIDKYLMTHRDIAYILKRIPLNQRLDFLKSNADILLDNLENNKMAFDVVLMMLPAHDQPDYMNTNVFFKIHNAKQLINVVCEYFLIYECAAFVKANAYVIRSFNKLFDITYFLPIEDRLAFVKDHCHLIKRHKDAEYMTKALPTDERAAFLDYFSLVAIKNKKVDNTQPTLKQHATLFGENTSSMQCGDKDYSKICHPGI